MSECSLCGEYSDCLHPVSFDNREGDAPEEIQPYLGLGNYLDDLDASDASEEFWDKCAHICHDCFDKYSRWIVWWG